MRKDNVGKEPTIPRIHRSPMLQDHGHGVRVTHGVPVYSLPA